MESTIQQAREVERMPVVLTLPLVGSRKVHRSRSTMAVISVWGRSLSSAYGSCDWDVAVKWIRGAVVAVGLLK
jgi:hypothetical protein